MGPAFVLDREQKLTIIQRSTLSVVELGQHLRESVQEQIYTHKAIRRQDHFAGWSTTADLISFPRVHSK